VAAAVRIQVASLEALDEGRGRWRITFRLLNDAASRVVVSDAWLPHGRFRGDGHIGVHIAVLPGEARALDLLVTAREDPGTVVENAFLILRTSAGRVFARMRVAFGADGVPRPAVEAVTSQSLE
jgi:hypothetical protein